MSRSDYSGFSPFTRYSRTPGSHTNGKGASRSSSGANSVYAEVAQYTPSAVSPTGLPTGIELLGYVSEEVIGRGDITIAYRVRPVDRDEPFAIKAIPTCGKAKDVVRVLGAEHRIQRRISSMEHVLWVVKEPATRDEFIFWMHTA